MRIFLIASILSISISAQARPGDLAEPFVIPSCPFVHAATTEGRDAQIARYDCDLQKSEVGPEVVYQLQVPSPGVLTAWVDGDANPIDIDVQILDRLEVTDGTAAGCLDRGNRWAAADVDAGPIFIVVDTYELESRAGPFRLQVDLQLIDEWYEREIANGVVLRTRIYTDLFGGKQTGSVLEVDPSVLGVTIKPITESGCTTTSELARNVGAVAAINGGFFGSGCASVSLLKIDGSLLATNSFARTSFGVDSAGELMMALVDAGQDWPAASQALGGVPRIVSGGAIDVRTLQEGSNTAFEVNRHPRTAVGITSEGTLLMATMDGRTSAGSGVSLPDLAQWMIWLGAEEALNLDGGGSTTLFADTPAFSGVVSYPSDNGTADHFGERSVSTVLGVWATPLDRAPIWLTITGTVSIEANQTWTDEIAAADPEGAAVRLFAEAPELSGILDFNARSDGTARISITPNTADASRPITRIFVHAETPSGGEHATQTILLSVTGAPVDAGLLDSGISDAGEEPTRDGGTQATDIGVSEPESTESTDEGCSCGSSPRLRVKSLIFALTRR